MGPWPHRPQPPPRFEALRCPTAWPGGCFVQPAPPIDQEMGGLVVGCASLSSCPEAFSVLPKTIAQPPPRPPASNLILSSMAVQLGEKELPSQYSLPNLHQPEP